MSLLYSLCLIFLRFVSCNSVYMEDKSNIYAENHGIFPSILYNYTENKALKTSLLGGKKTRGNDFWGLTFVSLRLSVI